MSLLVNCQQEEDREEAVHPYPSKRGDQTSAHPGMDLLKPPAVVFLILLLGQWVEAQHPGSAWKKLTGAEELKTVP